MNSHHAISDRVTIFDNEYLYVMWDKSNQFEIFDAKSDDSIHVFQSRNTPLDEDAAVAEIEFLL